LIYCCFAERSLRYVLVTVALRVLRDLDLIGLYIVTRYAFTLVLILAHRGRGTLVITARLRHFTARSRGVVWFFLPHGLRGRSAIPGADCAGGTLPGVWNNALPAAGGLPHWRCTACCHPWLFGQALPSGVWCRRWTTPVVLPVWFCCPFYTPAVLFCLRTCLRRGAHSRMQRTWWL
jgi:hypothetical protein